MEDVMSGGLGTASGGVDIGWSSGKRCAGALLLLGACVLVRTLASLSCVARAYLRMEEARVPIVVLRPMGGHDVIVERVLDVRRLVLATVQAMVVSVVLREKQFSLDRFWLSTVADHELTLVIHRRW